MIARLWRGWTSRDNADAYERLLRERVLPGLKRLDVRIADREADENSLCTGEMPSLHSNPHLHQCMK